MKLQKRSIPILITVLVAILAWMNSCNFSGELLSDEERDYYMDLGATTVTSTGGALMGNLTKALSEGGVEAAIPYCKMNADSLVGILNGSDDVISVRRTTEKPRNKANKATERDKNIFKVYEYAAKRGDSLKPILQTDPEAGEVVYYHPIMIQATCLQCHGNKDNGYTRENFDIINKHYPKDKAFNYSLGDMRGMWVVTMLQSESED